MAETFVVGWGQLSLRIFERHFIVHEPLSPYIHLPCPQRNASKIHVSLAFQKIMVATRLGAPTVFPSCFNIP